VINRPSGIPNLRLDLNYAAAECEQVRDLYPLKGPDGPAEIAGQYALERSTWWGPFAFARDFGK
jgi:hypothetical protein